MYGQSAYKPEIFSMSPSFNIFIPVAKVRLPPPLSPATTMRLGSTPNDDAFATTHLTPDTQSFRPAGKGATSGNDDGDTALRNSTITTTTPLAASSLPHPL